MKNKIHFSYFQHYVGVETINFFNERIGLGIKFKYCDFSNSLIKNHILNTNFIN